MTPSDSNVRFLHPVVASSVCSFALCILVGGFLLREQVDSADALGDNIERYRATVDLEQSLEALIALLQERASGVTAMNDRITRQIERLGQQAVGEQDADLVARLDASFQRYLMVWQTRPQQAGPEYDRAVTEAIALLEEGTRKRGQDLREANDRRIRVAEGENRAAVRGLAWGLAGVGGSAAFAGVFLGYGVARGITKSVQQLQVRVRDAAGKLGGDVPAVELDGTGDLGDLDAQMQTLVRNVERVVETLHEREREVLRAEQLAAVGQLAAGLAHEIRNPLTSIKMLVQMGRELDAAGGLPADDLAVIEREIRRVERSLQTFLDFARPPRPEKRPVDVGQAASETLELVRGRATKQGVALVYHAAPVPVVVNADVGQVRQVLVNLALNALDAMPAGGSLDLTVREDAGHAEVTVRDTGPGLAADVRAKLFRPFVSTKETGLGLGLVISKRIVEDHGGTIAAGDRTGGGAEFTVRLPRHATPSAGDSAAANR
jgi:signal transduction histidine kinase